MKVLVNKEIRPKFLELFSDYSGEGFSDLVPFLNEQVGFSVRHSYKAKRKEISMLKVVLMDETKHDLYPIYINATFGEMHDDGLSIRTWSQSSSHDPIDINVINDYFYDPSKNKIYKDNKSITGPKMLNEVYALHLKSTRKLAGMYLRSKLWLWRTFFKSLLKLITESLTLILVIISGIRYEYDPVFVEEKSNQLGNTYDGSGKIVEGKKINFFGYEANQWSIIFYCVATLAAYVIFYLLNYKPHLITDMVKNNFLVVLYAITSLWLIDSVIPNGLKKLIKKFTHYTLVLDFKKLNVK